MKDLKIGEVFTFLGSQYIVCGYNSTEGVIDSIDIWPFDGVPNDYEAIQRALMASIGQESKLGL